MLGDLRWGGGQDTAAKPGPKISRCHADDYYKYLSKVHIVLFENATIYLFDLNYVSLLYILLVSEICPAAAQHATALATRISEWAKPEPKLKSTVHWTSPVDAAP